MTDIDWHSGSICHSRPLFDANVYCNPSFTSLSSALLRSSQRLTTVATAAAF